MRHLKLAIGCALIAFLALSLTAATPKTSVEVIYVSGRVEFLSQDSSDWQAARVGKSLFSGDSIKTYEDSSVEISFDGRKENVVSINPNSHVVLKLFEQEKIELIDGEVFALITQLPHGSNFEIRTPTAVCGARGTGWGANADKTRTIVSGYENNSYAKGVDKNGNIMEDNLTVTQGFWTMVKLFGKPSKLSKISDKDYKKWNKWKDAFLERVFGKRTRRKRLSDDLDKIAGQRERMEDKKADERMRKTTEKTSAGSGTSDYNNEVSPR
ncbi:MAG: FecR domain-containing protein [Candidatus Omnitrophica bacterium]|nr:FecR domain-containing protein [Candidatus Omnitrophota bacterium]